MRRRLNCDAGGDSGEGNPAFRWKSLESRSHFTHDGDIEKRTNLLDCTDKISQRQRGEQILTSGWKTKRSVGNEKKVGKPGARRNENLISARKLQRDDRRLSEIAEKLELWRREKQNAGSSLCLFSELRESELFLSPYPLHRSVVFQLCWTLFCFVSALTQKISSYCENKPTWTDVSRFVPTIVKEEILRKIRWVEEF